MRYCSGLDPRHSRVVELQQYTTFEDVYVLAHRVEQQTKSKAIKREPPKPLPRNQPFNKGSTQLTPKTTGNSSQIAPNAGITYHFTGKLPIQVLHHTQTFLTEIEKHIHEKQLDETFCNF